MKNSTGKEVLIKTVIIILILIVGFTGTVEAQMTVATTNTSVPPVTFNSNEKRLAPSIKREEQTVYITESERIYVNKNLPIYLKFSTTPNGEVYDLKSEKHPQDAEPLYLDTEGLNYIRSKWAVDPETKEYAYPMREVQMELYADSKPPTVTPKLTTEHTYKKGKTTYYGWDLEINLQSWDEQAGVKNTFWSLNDNDWKTGTTTFEEMSSGNHKLVYYAVDNVNNYTDSEEINFVFDKTPPSTHLDETPDGTYVFGPNTKVQFTVEEEHSGTKSTFFKLDGLSFQKTTNNQVVPRQLADGTYEISYYSEDHVNNPEAVKKDEIYYDITAPETSLEATPSFTKNNILYLSASSKISLTASDNRAGVKATTFTTRGYKDETYVTPIEFENFNGFTSISFGSEDIVENKEVPNYQRIYVDTLRPSSEMSFQGDYFEVAGRYYVNAETEITLSGTDAQSGLSHIEYGGIGSDFETYEEPFSLENEGHYGMMYRAIDQVENNEYSNSVDLYLDTKGPAIVHNFSNKPLKTDNKGINIYPVGTRLFLGATDDQAGTGTISYQVNNQKKVNYSSPKTIDISEKKAFKKGKLYEVKITSSDLVNNLSEKTISFRIEE